MKATCPNDASHKVFRTVAHVMEEWLVDESGNCLQVVECLETVHPPCKGNIWECDECGATAKVEES